MQRPVREIRLGDMLREERGEGGEGVEGGEPRVEYARFGEQVGCGAFCFPTI
jgi:hypothetical protein